MKDISRFLKKPDKCEYISMCEYLPTLRVSDPEELGSAFNSLCFGAYIHCPFYQDYALIGKERE